MSSMEFSDMVELNLYSLLASKLNTSLIHVSFLKCSVNLLNFTF